MLVQASVDKCEADDRSTVMYSTDTTEREVGRALSVGVPPYGLIYVYFPTPLNDASTGNMPVLSTSMPRERCATEEA